MINEDEKKRYLEKDMAIAIKEILDVYPSKPTAILLCGGYGRDEGAWYIYDGKLSTYNDYDFAVISEYKLTNNEYQNLRRRIAELVNISWIDIAFYKPNYFKHLKPTIKNVDLLYASKVLFGDSAFLKKYNINAARIGTADILKLFKTRLWTFLGSWKGDFRDLDIQEARFFKNQMAKAILAACDMLLIKHRKYTPSYVSRVNLVGHIYKENENACKLSKWAIREKLEPSSNNLTKIEMEKLYWEVRDFFLWALNEACPKILKATRSKFSYLRFLYFHSDVMLHICYEAICKRSTRSKRVAELSYAQVCVFLAMEQNTRDSKKINEANSILLRQKYIDKPTNDWNSLREVVAYARNNV